MTTQHVGVAPRTAWVEKEGTVYAARVPDGPTLVLAGSGARIWLSVTRGGTLDAVTRRVARDVGSAPETLAADVAAFVTGLVEAGLVARGPGAAVPTTPDE